MAKRRIRAAELAGLAALGAFGYNFFGPGRDKKAGEERADVEYRGTDRPPAAISESPAASRLQETFMGLDDVGVSDAQRAAAIREGQNISAAELAANAAEQNAMLRGYDDMYANRAQRAARVGPAQAAPGAGAAAAGAGIGSNAARMERMRMALAEDQAAAARLNANRSFAGGSTGVDPAAPVNPRARQYNQDSQGNRAGTQADGGPPITEEMRRNPVARIPGQRSQAPEGGSRVTGSETSRNIANALGAMGPTRLAGFGNAAIEGATARGALQRAAALRAERAEAGRRGQTPTNFSSSSSSTTTRANRATKKTKKFDEDAENVEFKRGGKAMSKTKNMASGGMSSASKRGDGIASKGKTKCKMY